MVNRHNWIEAFHFDGTGIWMHTWQYPIIFYYDIEQETDLIMDILPEKYWKKTRQFSRLCHTNDSLYLLPMFANDVLKYDIKNQKFKCIPIFDDEAADMAHYYGAIRVKNKIFALSDQNVTICVDSDNDTIKLARSYYQNTAVRPNYSQYGEEYIRASLYSNEIIVYDKEFLYKTSYYPGKSEERFTMPIRSGENIYMIETATNKKAVTVYDITRRKTEYYVIDEILSGETHTANNYMGAFEHKGKIWFFPSNGGGNIISFGQDDSEICIENPEGRENAVYAFSGYEYMQDGFCLYELYGSSLYILYSDGRSEIIHLDVNTVINREVEIGKCLKLNGFKEFSEIKLGDFTKIINNSEKYGWI